MDSITIKIEEIRQSQRLAEDDIVLMKMGYLPALHRGLNSVMNFAIGFNGVAIFASICMMYGFSLTVGGPAPIIWGFVVNFVLTYCISLSLAEICSAYPNAGAVYNWAGQLAPEKYSSLCAYVAGWSNFLGNAASEASFADGFASFLSSALIISGHRGLETSEQVGVAISMLFLWSVLNFIRVDKVGWLNNAAALVHLGSFFLVVIMVLCVAQQHSSGAFVFTQYSNTSGINSKSYVVALCVTARMFEFAGYEGSAHLAEETTRSSSVAPRGIINTVLVTGFGGLSLMLSLLFITINIDQVLAGKTGNAACQVFIDAAGQVWGQGLSWLILVNLFFAGVSSTAVTARITYALARDNAFPCSSRLCYVHPVFKSPVSVLILLFVLDAFLMLLPLLPSGADTAFYSVLGLCTIGYQISYAIPIFLRLLIKPADFPVTDMSLGKWSYPCGIISCVWLLGTACLFFLPTSFPVNTDSMNWLIVVVGGVFLCGLLNWFFNSVKFEGPKRSAKDPDAVPSNVELPSTVELPPTTSAE